MNPQLQAQLNVRQQAEDLQDYMKDLFGWQKELKQKEKSLKRGADSSLPPVRGSAEPLAAPAPALAKPAAATVAAEAAPRDPSAHTYEHYRDRWERFDVDAALASDDEGDAAQVGRSSRSRGGGKASAPTARATASNNSSAGASESGGGGADSAAVAKPSMALPAARIRAAAQAAASRQAQPTTAEGWKDEGNRHFKAGAFQQALDCYSSSLALAPSCLAYANRAMAELKLGQFREAEVDCTEALLLDSSYVKAYQRRASARQELGDLLGAIDDCEAALCLEPANKATAGERQQCISRLLQQQGLVWAPSRERVPVRLAAGAVAGAAGQRGSGCVVLEGAGAGGSVEAGAAAAAAAAGAAPSDGEGVIEGASSIRSEGGPPQLSGGGSGGMASKAVLVCPVAEEPAREAGGPEGMEMDEEQLPPLALELPPPRAAQQAALPDEAGARSVSAAAAPAPATAPDAAEGRAVPTVPLAAASTDGARPAAAVGGLSGAAEARQTAPVAAEDAGEGAALQQVPPSQRPQAGTLPGASAAAGSLQLPPAAATLAAPAAVRQRGPEPSAALPAAVAPLEPSAAGAGSSRADGAAGIAATVAGALKHVTPATAMKAPRTGLEFEKGWKACKGDASLQADYLQLLPAAKLPTMLKQALTPALLTALLRALLVPGVQRAPAHAAAMLEALPAVPRFEMNLLSLPARDKAGLAQAWDQAQAQALVEAQGAGAAELAARLAAARQQYRM